MTSFSRYDYRYNEYGNRRTEEEIDQLEREFIKNEKLKQNKMIKAIGGGILTIVLSIFLFASCERIDAGHVGVKVNQYGDNKGVDDVVAVTGVVFYNPITTKVYEFSKEIVIFLEFGSSLYFLILAILIAASFASDPVVSNKTFSNLF